MGAERQSLVKSTAQAAKGDFAAMTQQRREEWGRSADTSSDEIVKPPKPQFRGGVQELGAARSDVVVMPKLVIGAPGDAYEQEADRVAQEVVQQIQSPLSTQVSPGVAVQRQGEEELQRKSESLLMGETVGGMTASRELEAGIQQARGGGVPLPEPVREPMERAFGADFSGVRIHANAQADQLNQSISAKAFTTGQDVFVRQGAYQPGMREGQALLAHELTHVVQQKSGLQTPIIQRFYIESNDNKEGYKWVDDKEWDPDIYEVSSNSKLQLGWVFRNLYRPKKEFAQLRQYGVINVIDLGGPGTGHQAGVIKLLESIARVGYGGQVILSYNTKKTRIYANKFGKSTELNNPKASYDLYHSTWTAVFPPKAEGLHRLNISCRPLGELGLDLSDGEKRVFGTLKGFWEHYAWPGAIPGTFADPEPTAKFGKIRADWNLKKQWSSDNRDLLTIQEKFRAKVDEKETGAGMVGVDALPDLPGKGTGVKTLTAFGAMDYHAKTEQEAEAPDFKSTYFEKHWLPTLKKMTGEDDPVSIILQPFLWTGGHAMQVRGGGSPTVDISGKIASAGGKAAFRWQPPKMETDDEVISKQPTIAKEVLQKAKSKMIHLVTAYYGAPVSDISYPRLLEVMVKVFTKEKATKPLVIALLGDDEKTAHIDTAQKINTPSEVGALNEKKPIPTLSIELAHIGRTQAMAQFQRYSDLFITEGANTWQEVLTLGTSALSVKPSGNTQPWTEGPTGGESDQAKLMVKEVSEALIAAGKDPDNSDIEIDKIASFIRDLRSDSSLVRKYFREWSVLLGRSESDQVVTALQSLPEVK